MNHECLLITGVEVHQNLADVDDDLTSSQHKRGHKTKSNPFYFIATEEKESH